MFHSRTLNNEINKWHNRCLRIVCNDKILSEENLLVRDRSASEHYPILEELFNKRNLKYEQRHPSQFTIPKVINIYNVPESLACLGAKIWNMVPSELKNILSKVLSKMQERNVVLGTVCVDYVKGTCEILVLFKLKV